MKKETGLGYIILALLSFCGLGIELLYALLLEPIIYGTEIQGWTSTQMICHWIITCISWGVVTVLLLYYVKKKYNWNLFSKKNKVLKKNWLIIIFIFIFLLIVSYLDWAGFKIIKEFNYNGLLKFVFQYIYYFFETMLVILIVVFGQKAFEIWTNNHKIPFGGIVCAATWGLVHVLTKGNILIGLLGALNGLVFGIIYLLVNKDLKKTFFITFLMFIA